MVIKYLIIYWLNHGVPWLAGLLDYLEFVYMENQLSKLLLIVQHAVPEPIQRNTVI